MRDHETTPDAQLPTSKAAHPTDDRVGELLQTGLELAQGQQTHIISLPLKLKPVPTITI